MHEESHATLRTDMVVIFFLPFMCTFLAYKDPEVDGPGLVTHANEHLFPKSLRNLAHNMSDKAFFCHLMTNQSPVVTRQ